MKKMGLFCFVLVLVLVVLASVTANAADKPVLEKINVFCVMSENIENEVKAASKALKETEGIDTFPNKGFQIHCTLYMTMYPEGSKDAVLAKISDFARKTHQFDINTSGLEVTSGNWFFMNLERNRNLQTLADAIVEMLSPLRSASSFVPDWAKPFPNKVEYISKFGSPNVYNEFNPHLTLLSKSEPAQMSKFMEAHKEQTFSKPIAGKVIAIGAGLADRDGQMPAVWEIFPLQK